MTSAHSDPRLTDADVASRINRSPKYVRMHAAEWPHAQFGRYRRFSEADMQEIIKLHRRTPKTSAERHSDELRPIGRGRRAS